MTALMVFHLSRTPWFTQAGARPIKVSWEVARTVRGQLWERVLEGKKRL